MNKLLWISFLCGLMVVAGTACKNENTPDNPENNTVKTRQLTIRMTDDAAGAPGRDIAKATITDGGTALSASWTEGDELSYCNLSSTTGVNEAIITGTLTAVSSAAKSDLTGTVDCMTNDYLAIVYPAADLAANSSKEEGSSSVCCQFTISLTGQDGTIGKLATNYHYVYGRAHVKSVTESTANATMDKMQSLLTVCKFSFKDKTTDAAIPINTLTISYKTSDSQNGTYPQSATVTVTNLTANSGAQAVGVAGASALTISAGGATEVYVALLPERDTCEYNFTVTSGGNTYTGTATALLKKGEYVVAPLKLTKNN